MNNDEMQAAIKEINATAVMAQTQKTQSEHIRDLREFQRRIEKNLAEITDKLNGLIGYIAGQRPPA